jgi:hypothetical protein
VFFFLFFTGVVASTYVMQLTEGKPTPTPPFIGSDPLYNGILNVAIRREEVDVVKC